MFKCIHECAVVSIVDECKVCEEQTSGTAGVVNADYKTESFPIAVYQPHEISVMGKAFHPCTYQDLYDPT